MKVAAVVTFFTLPALSDRVLAGEKTLSWWHDECDYSVNFDPGEHDEERVRNTVRLLYGPPDFKAPVVGLPFNPQSVARLNLDHTRHECRKALEVAGRLEFVPLEGIEDYRRAVVAQIEDTCEFETAEIRGYHDPAALREYQPAAACSPFIDALEGKRDVMAAFRLTLDRHCSYEAGSAQCVERELARSQKADGLDWVRLYLMKFGWNSCASEFTRRSTDSRKLEQVRAGLEEQFRQAFKITSKTCDAAADSRPQSGATSRAVAETTRGVPARSAESPPTVSPRRHLKASHLRRARAPRAGNPSRRTALRMTQLPTPFAADWSRQMLRLGRR